MRYYRAELDRSLEAVTTIAEAQRYCRRTAAETKARLVELGRSPQDVEAATSLFNAWVEPLVSFVADLYQQVYTLVITRKEEQRKLDNLKARVRTLSRLALPLDLENSFDPRGQSVDRIMRIPELISSIVRYAPRINDYTARPKSFQHGPFTIYNHHGYTSDEINDKLEVLDRAAAAITTAGFKEILYGDVYLTDLTFAENYAGRYTGSSDSIELAQNVHHRFDTVYTLVHEIGHRLWFKVLGDTDRAAYEAAYASGAAYVLTVEDRRRFWDALIAVGFNTRSLPRLLGQSDAEKARLYYHDTTNAYTRGLLQNTAKNLALESNQRYLENFGRTSFVREKTPLVYADQRGVSVTDYGDSHVKEDFAEIFAHYVLGKPIRPDARARFMTALGVR